MSHTKDRKFYISVLPENFVDSSFEYSNAIKWTFENLNHINVFEISESEISELEKIWDIINEVNHSMIGLYEDSWVPVQKDRIQILENLKTNQKLNTIKYPLTVQKIISLFQIAVNTNQNIYFLF